MRLLDDLCGDTVVLMADDQNLIRLLVARQQRIGAQTEYRRQQEAVDHRLDAVATSSDAQMISESVTSTTRP